MNWQLRTFDWNAVSAIATLTAVLVALFLDSIRRRRNSPRLDLTLRSRDAVAFPVDEIFDKENAIRIHRLLVKNRGREAAQQVEVVLTDLYSLHGNDTLDLVRGFIPTGLRWTHLETAVCPYLPAQAERLCDLGVYKNISTKDDTEDEFEFTTVVNPTNRYNRLRGGGYIIRIVASAINCKPSELLLSIAIGPHPEFTRSEDGEFFYVTRATQKQGRLLRESERQEDLLSRSARES